MNEITFTIIGMVLVLILGTVIGYCINEVYREYNNKQELRGLWLKGYNSTQAMKKVYSLDDSGQWVCVNINKNLDYEDIVETCLHEAGHELFARKCADDPEVCFKLAEELENE